MIRRVGRSARGVGYIVEEVASNDAVGKDAKREGEDEGKHQEEEGLRGAAWDVDRLLHNLDAAQFLQIL